MFKKFGNQLRALLSTIAQQTAFAMTFLEQPKVLLITVVVQTLSASCVAAYLLFAGVEKADICWLGIAVLPLVTYALPYATAQLLGYAAISVRMNIRHPY